MRLVIFLIIGIYFDWCQCMVSYDGYQVIRTHNMTEVQARILEVFVDSYPTNYNFWKRPNNNGTAEVSVSPSSKALMDRYLEVINVSYTVMIKDVGKLIRDSEKTTASRKSHQITDWDKYFGYDEMKKWMDSLGKDKDFVDVVSIGKTYEGREMNVISITKAGEGKPNVWIEAGIHAREWIAPAVALYFIDQLLNGDESSEFVEKLNFHIIPVANPDGYEYTRTTDRYWRKNRSPQEGDCVGADPNRNWDYHWGGKGTSPDPCSVIYPGNEPFSEMETKNMAEFLKKMNPVPIFTLSLHSFSQLWFYPYAYDYNKFPDNVDELKELGDEAVKALKDVHGTDFEMNNIPDSLSPSAGSTFDWYAGVLGVRFAFAAELRDTGEHGFILPEDQIKPSGEEMWAAMKVVLNKMIDLNS